MTSETLSSSKLGGAARRTAEDHQALGRPTHPGGQVVEAEQLLEALRVLLVLLQRLDQRELLVDQRGVAARERHEHGADLRPQLGLAGRQGDRLLVHVVDRPGELTELLVGCARGSGRSRRAPRPFRIRRDRLGQLLVATSRAPARTLRSGTISARATNSASSSEASRASRMIAAVGQGSGLRSRGAVRQRALDAAEQPLVEGVVAANMPGVAASSATFAVVAWPSRVPLAEMRLPAGGRRSGACRLSSAEPSTPISAASQTESSSEALLAAALDQQLLLDQRQPGVQGLDQRLDPRVRACRRCSASS